MENKLKIKAEINNREVIFEVIVKGTNDYLINAIGYADDIIVREITRKQSIVFFKTYIIADVKVGAIRITNDQYEQIKTIEEGFRQKALDADRQRKEALISGKTKFNVPYHNGKAISGHIIFGLEAELLKDLGVAIEFGGWRTKVDQEMIETLGEEFTYQEAAEYAKPIMERKEKEKDKKKKERKVKTEEKLTEAKQTGKKIVIHKWQEECDNPNEICDIDNMVEYALPDGTTEITRKHTGLMK